MKKTISKKKVSMTQVAAAALAVCVAVSGFNLTGCVGIGDDAATATNASRVATATDTGKSVTKKATATDAKGGTSKKASSGKSSNGSSTAEKTTTEKPTTEKPTTEKAAALDYGGSYYETEATTRATEAATEKPSNNSSSSGSTQSQSESTTQAAGQSSTTEEHYWWDLSDVTVIVVDDETETETTSERYCDPETCEHEWYYNQHNYETAEDHEFCNVCDLDMTENGGVDYHLDNYYMHWSWHTEEVILEDIYVCVKCNSHKTVPVHKRKFGNLDY